MGTSPIMAPCTPMLPCSRPTPACSRTACIRPVTRVYPLAMFTARVSCQQLMYWGPGVSLTFWRASASHTGAHSEPGDEIM